jgi:hypothetical protein
MQFIIRRIARSMPGRIAATEIARVSPSSSDRVTGGVAAWAAGATVMHRMSALSALMERERVTSVRNGCGKGVPSSLPERREGTRRP